MPSPFTMKTRVVSCFLLLWLCVFVSSCGPEVKKYKIGISQCSQDDWRTKMNDEIRREALLHDDVIVEIRSADDSNEKQKADIEYFVRNHFDILIVSPNEAAALTPIIKKVYESGTPVIIFDRNINDTTYTARIGVDDAGIGRSAAQYARHLVGPQTRAKAIEIYGLPGSTPAEDRHKGFAAAFAAQNDTLLGSAPANWNKEDAIPVTDSLLSRYPDTNLIYAHNDRMAVGAAEVTRRRGRTDIKIIGIDAAPNIGIRAVADGVIDATFLYPTEGHRLVQTALAILRNQPYRREVILPVSSAVDKTNADILLLQNETLKQETRKIALLKTDLDHYWARHATQTVLIYACVVIIVLLCGMGFLLLRAYWQHRRHQRELTVKNKQLEAERDKQARQGEQLRQATQAKLRFFTNVSHDLRTPLTLIAEPVSSVASASNLTAEQSVLMKLAVKNVKIIKRMIDQILDFRKYENGVLSLNLVELDFGATLEGWVRSFMPTARRRDIKLILSPATTSEPIKLALDAEKMERVVFNLISNALKHTPANGQITVAYRLEAEQLILSVSDTGEGIQPDDLSHVFDRFFQAPQVHPDGSGIGLSLVKAFVELHGGTVGVVSTPGQGTTFTATLPLRYVAEAATISSVAGPEKEPDTGEADIEEIEPICEVDVEHHVITDDKPIVLVIDDNADIQTLLSHLLGSDYVLLRAHDGREGVKKAAKYVPDLIICDMMMPVMDGLTCLRRLKSEPSTSHIPVLMLTACRLDEQRAQSYDSGADGYLSKPFDGRVLKSRCAGLIEGRKRIESLWQSRVLMGDGGEAAADGRVDRDGGGAVKRREGGIGDIDDAFYGRFLELFRREMSNPSLSVDALAAEMHLERSQFYRKIKSLTNYAPVELIRRLRLHHARGLLLQTELSVGEIAYKTGFSSPAYFTKCYRDAYGETPSQARSNLTKN